VVEIQIYGADGDSRQFKTPPFKRDKGDPVWTKKNVFKLDNCNEPRHALVYISATSSNGASLGWACLPLPSIRPGFRCVALEGAPTTLAHVILEIKIGPLKQHAGSISVVMAGEMEMRPVVKSAMSRRFNFGGWTWRYFVLTNTVLQYQQERMRSAPLGELPLALVERVLAWDAKVSGVQKFGLTLVHYLAARPTKTKDSRKKYNLVLSAPTESLRDEWVREITRSCRSDCVAAQRCMY